jgi:hypothetical protein
MKAENIVIKYIRNISVVICDTDIQYGIHHNAAHYRHLGQNDWILRLATCLKERPFHLFFE